MGLDSGPARRLPSLWLRMGECTPTLTAGRCIGSTPGNIWSQPGNTWQHHRHRRFSHLLRRSCDKETELSLFEWKSFEWRGLNVCTHDCEWQKGEWVNRVTSRSHTESLKKIWQGCVNLRPNKDAGACSHGQSSWGTLFKCKFSTSLSFLMSFTEWRSDRVRKRSMQPDLGSNDSILAPSTAFGLKISQIVYLPQHPPPRHQHLSVRKIVFQRI